MDIGKIAINNKPKELELVHNILLASSAVPGIFPPGLIDVVVDNKKFTELHVDGGVTRQAFLYPPQFIGADLIKSLNDKIERKSYIIRNGRNHALYEPVETNLYSIALRSHSMTIENNAATDLYWICNTTIGDGIDCNLAIIPISLN